MNTLIGIEHSHVSLSYLSCSTAIFPWQFLDSCGHVLCRNKTLQHHCLPVEENDPEKLTLVSGYLSGSYCVMGWKLIVTVGAQVNI